MDKKDIETETSIIMKPSKTVTYEQPVNEHTRICLRLEHLFKRINQFVNIDSPVHTQSVLESIIEVVNVVDRTDLKPMLLKELKRFLETFVRLQQSPNIDHTKLEAIMAQLENIVDVLNSPERKMAESLRQNEFLSAIRIQRSNLGGVCPFDVPHYFYWLQLPYDIRRSHLDNWLQEIEPLKITVNLILQLIRESALPEEKTAHQGLFHTALDPKTPCQMVRVIIPIEAQAYPEISVGRHRIYLRFFLATINVRPDFIAEDITFKLTCCAL